MKLFAHNWLAIFYFNFRMLPLKQAIHLPFDFCHKVKFKRLSGKIIIDGNNISRGMIRVGAQGSDMFDGASVIIDIAGTLRFNVCVGSISIGTGSLLRVERNGLVELNDGVVLGVKNIVLCEQSISFGEQTISSWNCQFMDTDTHSIIDLDSGDILPRSHPIKIGRHCWIGNHVLVNKGTILPDDTIVASYSLCNKDYRNMISENSVIGGIPAKKLVGNKKRSNDKL